MILKKIKLLFKTEDSFSDTKDVFQSKLFNRHIYFVKVACGEFIVKIGEPPG